MISFLSKAGLEALWARCKAAFAPKSHSHSAGDLTDEIPISKGGTGAATAEAARSALGVTPANIGAAAASHSHNSLSSRGQVAAEEGSSMPATFGLSMAEAMSNGYPSSYGNVLTMRGSGSSQILAGWSGTSGEHAPVYVRSKRDQIDAPWSDWAQVYTTADPPSASDVGAAEESHTHGAASASAAGFMSSADKSKLDGIAANANNYAHPTSAAGAKASGLYKISTDASGHVTGAQEVTKGDITALGIPAQDTNTTYQNATASAAGLMSAGDKAKLDGIAANANNYALPQASSTTLGGVKFASNRDFCAYMGITYNASDWS